MTLRIPNRRQFLRGAAGFTLALPFLESLRTRPARAGDPPYAPHARFICMTTQHGGVWGSNMFPADGAATATQTLYPGHTMHHGALTATTTGGQARLSNVLSAPEALLSSALVSKMNVIRGLDIPFYIGHHTGGDLGNYGRNDGEYDNPTEYRPTIDQVMAYSSSFYPDITSITARSMHIGTHPNHCWGYSNPAQQSGEIQAMPLSQSAQALFNQIFIPEEEEGPAPRPLVVDRVIESYRRLHDGAFGDAARLGVRDRQRLEDHMDRLRDLEIRLNAVADCSDVTPIQGDTQGLDVGGYSTNHSDIIQHYRLYNDVIVAAFMCGTSRIAVINSGETWSHIGGLCCSFHDNVAHMSAQPDGVAQQWLVEAKQRFFENVFLDLANKLDVEEANGISFLDNSLMFWTQESGSTTHDPISLPVVMAGSAAGFFQTGRYIDYRNRNSTAVVGDYMPEYALRRPGLPYNRWLANIMMSMGLAPAEFEYPGEHGYGLPLVDNPQAWSSQMMNDSSELLPILVA
jgi:hypothetical protein